MANARIQPRKNCREGHWKRNVETMEHPFRTDAYASEEWVVLVLCKALLLLASVHPV